MTTFKPRARKTAQHGFEVVRKPIIPKAQINIIKSTLESFMSGSSSDVSSGDEE